MQKSKVLARKTIRLRGDAYVVPDEKTGYIKSIRKFVVPPEFMKSKENLSFFPDQFNFDSAV